MEVLSIQEEQRIFEAKLELTLQWKDRRVEFHNLKQKNQDNLLTLDEQLSLWTPTLFFRNSKEELVTVNDEAALMNIRREGKSMMSENNVTGVMDEYPGSENSIIMSRIYSAQFYCDYTAAWYPFNDPTCEVELVLDNSLRLHHGYINYTGTRELPDFIVKTWNIDTNNNYALTISITMGRKVLGFFLTIYFPTILMNHALIHFSTDIGNFQ